VGVSSGGWAL